MTAIIGIAGFGQTVSTPSVSLTDQSISDSAAGTATAGYTINSNGRVQDQASTLESWLLGSGTNSNYEVRATVDSGTLTSGTTGSWLNCGTSRSWSKSNSAMNNSVVTCVLTIEIRLASSGVVQDSATVTLSAESDNFN